MKIRLPGIILLTLIYTGCASTPSDVIEPADVLYRQAYESMQNNNFALAGDRLNTIMARYPFTPFAVQAHLDSLYVFHQLEQPEVVAEEAERFVRENPRHPSIAYAYYMKGLAYYREEPTLLDNWFDVDIAAREMEYSKKSFQYFRELTVQFPDSEFAVEARQRMLELRYRMARHEIHAAEYYVRRGAWISAIGRASTVLKEFPNTPSEIDALMILARSYAELGLDDLAEETREILAANQGRSTAVIDDDFEIRKID